MAYKITTTDLTGLTNGHAAFVIEYLKDFMPRRAAIASGYAADTGYQLIERPDVKAIIDNVLVARLEASDIDAEWVLMQSVDNHMIARQTGNISASNTALNLIAKHTFVDALAAEKVEVSSDKEVMERLMRGRKRMNQDDESISFL